MQLPTPVTAMASGDATNIKLLIRGGYYHHFHYKKLALSCQECQFTSVSDDQSVTPAVDGTRSPRNAKEDKRYDDNRQI